MTKTQDEALRARIAELEATLEQEQQKYDEQGKLLERHKARDVGWLITTPYPLFNESVYGIPFKNGMAFIQRDQRVEYFEFEPAKESTLKRMYSEEEIKAIRKREREITSAQRAVTAIKDDFGYQVEYFGPGEASKLLERMKAREREVALEQHKLSEAEENIYPPYMMGEFN